MGPQNLFKHQLLTPESLNKMHHLHCFTNAEQTMGYGYGLNVEWLSYHNHPIKHI
ncbi:hypothetical protein [Candidatus Protochlamydia amoebophila]|uniref:hypothetical protein n=1 Tax=Candidatus Protochlamydia amoebophila TaxID=362787 RepID=UPI0015EEBD9F|nr:hypothetical protein [Candidatus Protochlamydia amoebophila]